MAARQVFRFAAKRVRASRAAPNPLLAGLPSPLFSQLEPLLVGGSEATLAHDLYEGETGGEFREFVRKVLAERVTFDPGFLRAVFDETAGHPYLTVNLLVSLVDWLIATRSGNIGMVQRSERLRFTLKTGQAVGVLGQVG